MKIKGHLIMSLLRILTPEEISRLTTSHSGKKKVSLSLLLRRDRSGRDYRDVFHVQEDREDRTKAHERDSTEKGSHEEAKVLEFRKEREEESSFQAGPHVKKLLFEYIQIFKKMNKNIFEEKRFSKKKRTSSLKQASSLIIEEKRKTYASYSKIKKMEVLSLYKNTSKIDIENQKKNKEDIAHSSSLGVLVNKRQA